jgi:hypothetical protein
MKTILCSVLLSALFFTSCQKEYSTESTPGTTSTFSYDGEPNNCVAPVIQGAYLTGTPLDSTNIAIIAVDVTKLGSYSITTNTINGIKFSGSGIFTATGSQDIVLTGSGTPVAQGPYGFKTAATGCTFTIDIVSAGPAAVYTYTGAPGNCTGPAISGTYTSGINLGPTNTVDLKVNVTTAGSYTVTTNAANGVSFSGSGTLATGVQTIRLTGQGKPAAAGPFTFTPTNNGCAFSITFAPPLPPATFTFAGTPGNCSTPVISGTYTAGTALTAANTIVLTVNVTVAGAYSVTTNSTNGVTFSGSGAFTTTGLQTITLTSTNTPALAGNFLYTPAGTGGCTFSITYNPAGGGGTPASTYYLQFKSGTTFIAADTAAVVALIVPNAGLVALSIEASSITMDTSFAIAVVTTGNPLINVSYNTNAIGIPLSSFDMADATGLPLYTADFSTPAQNMVIKFELIDVPNKVVKGTFSGTAKTATGVVTITEGKFRAMIQ